MQWQGCFVQEVCLDDALAIDRRGKGREGGIGRDGER